MVTGLLFDLRMALFDRVYAPGNQVPITNMFMSGAVAVEVARLGDLAIAEEAPW